MYGYILYMHTHVCTLMHAVKSWEGGENSIDGVSVSGEWKKREADAWDQELDKGKVFYISLQCILYRAPLYVHTCCIAYCAIVCILIFCAGEECQGSEGEPLPTEESVPTVPEQEEC